ncbi:MAG: replication-relaxation family protein [Actinomycetota bacterium]|nr:replication-relaxation family protein [Actinomycetota bacterium]
MGIQPMLQNPMSKVVLTGPDAWAEPAPPSAAGSEAEPPLRVLPPTGRQLVALLGTHEVLTSGQLVRLTGLPERTVQHHLGLLYRDGLVSRVRPPREVGTSPYHCWPTAFGAAAIGAEKPGARSDDLAGVQATAALSEPWPAVRDCRKGVGLELRGWRRLPSGLPYQDPHTGTIRELPAEAQLNVALGPLDIEVTMLVVSRVERVPVARLAAVLARFAGYLTSSYSERCPPVLAVLARTPRVAERVLTTADTLGAALGQPPRGRSHRDGATPGGGRGRRAPPGRALHRASVGHAGRSARSAPRRGAPRACGEHQVKAHPATARSRRGGEPPADRTAQLPRHPQSQRTGSPRYPQGGPTDHHHHPQSRADGDARHPQASSGSAAPIEHFGLRTNGRICRQCVATGAPNLPRFGCHS